MLCYHFCLFKRQFIEHNVVYKVVNIKYNSKKWLKRNNMLYLCFCFVFANCDCVCFFVVNLCYYGFCLEWFVLELMDEFQQLLPLVKCSFNITHTYCIYVNIKKWNVCKFTCNFKPRLVINLLNWCKKLIRAYVWLLSDFWLDAIYVWGRVAYTF